MVPGVDGTLAESPRQMEQTGGRWRTSSRIPEFIRPGTGSPSGGTSTHNRPQRRLQGDGGQGHTRSTTTSHRLAKEADKEKERNGNGKKMVTMAPVSRCMSSTGQYVARRPLVSTERHTSILKNPLSQELTTQDKNQTGSTGDSLLHNERTFHFNQGTKDSLSLTCPSPSKSYGLSLSPSPSMSREDLSFTSPLTTADLRTWSEEPFPRSKSSPAKNYSHSLSRRSLSSPPLDVYNLEVPATPNFTSTQRKSYVPSSTSTSPSRLSRKTTKADSLLRDTTLKPIGSTLVSKVSPPPFSRMSPYQANYWTCAIPTSLPPSPDRSSPSWDPNKEYEDLLDYTYPLRPGYTAHAAASGHKWASAPGLDSSRLQPKTPEVILEDSGIELDRFCSSSTLSCLDQSAGVSRSRSKGGNLNPHSKKLNKSLGLQGLSCRELSHSKSSDGRLSSSLYSLDHIGLSEESLESDVKGRTPGQQGSSLHYKNQGVYSTSRRSPTTFIPTLRVMPRPGLLGDLDEEFLALPQQLYEIQVLSQHLKDISAQVCQLPVTSSWESLERERERDNSSNQSIETVTAMQEDEEEEMEEQEEEEEDREGSVLGSHPRVEEPSEGVRVLESALHMLSGEVSRARVKEVASIMDRLGGVSLSESEDQTKESLMHHIQAFCGNLQELIQWLYTIVHKMESLTPPSVDIESVKTSLADYKSFQRDVHAHRPLTGAVLNTGEKLLRCMNSTSPVLKETLGLIERQSQALETHAEHLFSSILSAMDSLAEASSREGTECSD